MSSRKTGSNAWKPCQRNSWIYTILFKLIHLPSVYVSEQCQFSYPTDCSRVILPRTGSGADILVSAAAQVAVLLMLAVGDTALISPSSSSRVYQLITIPTLLTSFAGKSSSPSRCDIHCYQWGHGTDEISPLKNPKTQNKCTSVVICINISTVYNSHQKITCARKWRYIWLVMAFFHLTKQRYEAGYKVCLKFKKVSIRHNITRKVNRLKK